MDQLDNIEQDIKELANAVAGIGMRLMAIEGQISAISHQIESKKVKPTGLGIPVWDAYAAAYMKRYGHEPVRNAKVNRACVDIAKRLGADAVAVTTYFLSVDGSECLRMNHPIGMLLQRCESYHSMWKSGKVTTAIEARSAERRSTNMSASQSYLQRKHGAK